MHAAKDVRMGKGGRIAFVDAHSGQDGGALSAQTLRVEAEGRPTFTRGRASGRGGAIIASVLIIEEHANISLVDCTAAEGAGVLIVRSLMSLGDGVVMLFGTATESTLSSVSVNVPAAGLRVGKSVIIIYDGTHHMVNIPGADDLSCGQRFEHSVRVINEGPVECGCALGFYGSFTLERGVVCQQCPGMSTTFTEGRTRGEECHCMSGWYRAAGTDICVKCKTGMGCDGTTDELPVQKAGYSVRYISNGTEPLVYSCTSTEACPEAQYGQSNCSDGAFGIACADCDAEYHWDGIKCIACGSFTKSTGIALLVLIVSPMTLVPVYSYVTKRCKQTSDDSSGPTGNWMIVTFPLSFVGMLSAISVLNIRWRWPLAAPLRFVRASTVDLSFLSLQCGMKQRMAHVVEYALIAFVPWVAGTFCILAVQITKKCVKIDGRSVLNKYFGILLAVVVPVLVHSTKPFRFLVHRGADEEVTLLAYPSLYTNTPDHQKMIFVSSGSLTCCFAFVASCVWATRILSGGVSSAHYGSIRVSYEFLTSKFRKGYHGWSLVHLLRSVLLVLIPIVCVDATFLQIFLTVVLLLVATIPTSLKLPWTTPLLNSLDIGISCSLISLLVLGAMIFTADQPNADIDEELSSLALSLPWVFGIPCIVVGSLILYQIIALLCGFSARQWRINIAVFGGIPESTSNKWEGVNATPEEVQGLRDVPFE